MIKQRKILRLTCESFSLDCDLTLINSVYLLIYRPKSSRANMKQNRNLRDRIKLISEFQQRYKRKTNGKLLEAFHGHKIMKKRVNKKRIAHLMKYEWKYECRK